MGAKMSPSYDRIRLENACPIQKTLTIPFSILSNFIKIFSHASKNIITNII